MKNQVVRLLLALFLFALAFPAAAQHKVPVDIGEGIITFTIPLVVDDESIVIKMFGDKEDKSLRKGEVKGYATEVYYPETWKLAVQSESQGTYTVTFTEADRQGEPSVSLQMDLRHPLNNVRKEEREQFLHELVKVLGAGVKDLTFTPERGMVRWIPTPYTEVRKLAGLENLTDALLITEKVILPPQKDGPTPFAFGKIGLLKEVDQEKLIALGEIAPFLRSLRETSPIRVKEGFLERRMNPDFKGEYAEDKAWEWVLIKNKGVINVIPYLEYFAATGEKK